MNFNMNAAQFQHKLAEMEEENLMLRLQLDVYRDELFKKYESFLDEKLTTEMEKKTEPGRAQGGGGHAA